MKAWHRTLVGVLIVLALPAGPASAERGPAASETEGSEPAPPFRQSGYYLSHGAAVLAPGASMTHRAGANLQRHRAAIGAGPATDPWAGLPNPSMSYRAGKRGPVIQLGAFGGALAHVSLDWDF